MSRPSTDLRLRATEQRVPPITGLGQPTLGVTGVTFKTTEPGSNFSYQLVAVPDRGRQLDELATSRAIVDRRGFAMPAPAPTRRPCASSTSPVEHADGREERPVQFGRTQFLRPAAMSRPLANSPFTLAFCLSVSAPDHDR